MHMIPGLEKMIRLYSESPDFNALKNIANQMLNEYQLFLNSIPWEIIEIEFYLNTQMHQDPFTHKHKDYQTGQFRIHNAGIDIALSYKDSYGGILIRSMKKPGSEMIEGPVKVCDAIIKNMGTIEKACISLKKREIVNKNHIYYSPRVGLKIKDYRNAEPLYEFLVKNYRFYTCKQLKAEKYMIALSLKHNFNIDLPGLDASTLEKYMEAFYLGLKHSQNVILPDNKYLKAYLYGFYSKKIEY